MEEEMNGSQRSSSTIQKHAFKRSSPSPEVIGKH